VFEEEEVDIQVERKEGAEEKACESHQKLSSDRRGIEICRLDH
jgi:hypothetical protein